MRKLDQLQAANALRVVKLMFAFMLVCHWVACGWYFIGVHEESNDSEVEEASRSWTAQIKSGQGVPLSSDNLAVWYQVRAYVLCDCCCAHSGGRTSGVLSSDGSTVRIQRMSTCLI